MQQRDIVVPHLSNHALCVNARILSTSTALYTRYFSSLQPDICHPCSLNVVQIDDQQAGQLVRRVVKLDRLPPHNSLEGLELLMEAWCEHDIADYHATTYKILAKLLYALQLLVSWALVLIGTLKYVEADWNTTMEQSWQHIIFGLSAAGTFLIALDAYLSAKSRWLQLRSSAGVLESIIWMYRTRVGVFQLDVAEPDSEKPEKELCRSLNKWRQDIISSSDLQASDLKRAHVNVYSGNTMSISSWFSMLNPRRIYKHKQYEDEQVYQDADDDNGKCRHCMKSKGKHHSFFSGLYCEVMISRYKQLQR